LTATVRTLRDRLGETLRRYRHGLLRPLWADMTEPARESYRDLADQFVRIAASVGLRIAITDTDATAAAEALRLCRDRLALAPRNNLDAITAADDVLEGHGIARITARAAT